MSLTHRDHQNFGGGYIEDQREFFDSLITRDWCEYINTDWDRARKQEVDDILMRIPAPTRVLDLGCGCGYHDVIFAEAIGVESVVGIDYSEKSIQAAQSHYPHPKVERYVSNLCEVEGSIREKGSFDLVASFQVIEHLSDPRKLIETSALFAREGGYVAVVTPNGKRLQNLWLRITGKPVEMIDPLHFREYGIRELMELGRKSGLTSIAYFARGIRLVLGGHEAISPKCIIGRWLEAALPKLCDSIGVIFRK